MQLRVLYSLRFGFVKLAENIGSGFHKMINGWNSHYHLKPLIGGDFDFLQDYVSYYYHYPQNYPLNNHAMDAKI